MKLTISAIFPSSFSTIFATSSWFPASAKLISPFFAIFQWFSAQNVWISSELAEKVLKNLNFRVFYLKLASREKRSQENREKFFKIWDFNCKTAVFLTISSKTPIFSADLFRSLAFFTFSKTAMKFFLQAALKISTKITSSFAFLVFF